MRDGEITYRKPLSSEEWTAIFERIFFGVAPEKTFRELLGEEFKRQGWVW